MRRVTRRRRWSTGVALLVVCVLIAACSGGGKRTDGKAGGPTTQPVPGGRLVYGVSADADGFNPTIDAFAQQAYIMGGTIMEPLTYIDADGNWRPVLAESVKPAKNATEWTIKLRPGVTFSTGEPLTAEVVKANLDAQKKSPLTGAVLFPMKSTEVVDERTVRVTLSSAWVTFPIFLAGQVGFVIPKASLDNPGQASRKPVGTGPFVLKQYAPGSRFVVKKNPNYWQRGLPYLDEIEFRILPDSQTRSQTFESGGLDVMLGSRDEDIVRFGKRGDQVYRPTGMSVPEFSFMLNTARPPFDDLRLRQALAYATDRKVFVDTLRGGLTEVADGPWSKDSKWYVPGNYPGYDLTRAKALVQQYEAEKGPVKIELLTVPDPVAAENAQLAQAMWGKAGVEVGIRQVDQADLIQRALTGNYTATLWILFFGSDPDAEYIWWHTLYAHPIGQISINMTRIQDQQLSAALDEGRSNTDEAVRKQAYGVVQQRLRDLLPYIWVDHVSIGSVIAKPYVHGLVDFRLPSGQKGMPLIGAPGPIHPLHYAWRSR